MPERTRKTAYGVVNAEVLERLEQSFETQRLLEAVDQLDRFAGLATDGTLRQDMLRLHGMAHTILNGAPITVRAGRKRIWELAVDLSMEIEDAVEGLSAALRLLEQLAELAPEFGDEDVEEEDS